VDASGTRRLERENGGADIAADLGVVTGAAHDMCNERRGGRFPVGSRDRDERSLRRLAAPLAAVQLDVADHLDRRRARKPDRPVRGGMGERHPGGEHQRRNPGPFDMTKIGGRHAGARRLCNDVRIVVPANHVGAAGEQRARAREPGASQPEDCDLLSHKGRDRDQ
jgi:hypothetical protein